MYHNSDTSAALAAAHVGEKPAATHFAGAEYAKFDEMEPAENQNGARTWYARGQNFIIAYSDADEGMKALRRIADAAYGYFHVLARSTPFGARVPLDVIPKQ